MSDLIIIGIDEVGRGCLAGPISACAFAYHPGTEAINGVKDSKKLSAKARGILDPLLRAAGTHGYGEVSSEEIDEIGINAANHLAMRRAVINMGFSDLSGFSIVVDGNQLPDMYDLMPGHIECIVKADDTVPSVSAASIIAKVTRDRLMEEAAKTYPGYGFESHAGYGTKAHFQAINELGPCPMHRMSFAPMSEMTISKSRSLKNQ